MLRINQITLLRAATCLALVLSGSAIADTGGMGGAPNLGMGAVPGAGVNTPGFVINNPSGVLPPNNVNNPTGTSNSFGAQPSGSSTFNGSSLNDTTSLGTNRQLAPPPAPCIGVGCSAFAPESVPTLPTTQQAGQIGTSTGTDTGTTAPNTNNVPSNSGSRTGFQNQQ